jgi:diacylglycerol kinase family enzyme
MTRSGFLIVNPRSGEDSGLEELTAAARARGLEVHVLREGDDLAELARGADAEAIGMAGGDGSLAPVASVCIERGLPLVCVPFGTRNHFARDLGLDPDDPVAMLAAFEDRVERRIDVGRANDLLFLNNVSLGVYARLVHRREHHRRRREALARLRAIGETLRHRESLGITADGEPIEARVVLVANNAYALDLLSLGGRERLDEGLLYLYLSPGLLRHEWLGRSGVRFTIDAREHRLPAAFDGEPRSLETPIEFSVEPAALSVLLPRRPEP